MNEYLDLALTHIDSLGYRFDWKELLLGLATPLFFGALGLEMFVLRKRFEIFKFKEILSNFGLGFAYQGVEVVLHFLFIGAFMYWLSGFSFFELEMDIPTRASSLIMPANQLSVRLYKVLNSMPMEAGIASLSKCR